MGDDRKFRQRLDAWRKELKNQIITRCAPLSFSGFCTRRRLSPEEAGQGVFLPMPPGTPWGMRREYGWFAADAALPYGCEGQRIVLLSGVDGEQLVHLEGKPIGSVDRHHSFVTLFRSAPAHASFHLLIESYAGNGPRLEDYGPCPPERDPLPSVTAPQCRIRESCLAVFHETAYQLSMDVETLTQLLGLLPESSLRREKIREALEAFTHVVDFEVPPAEREASFRAGRAVLREVLSCRNGSTAPLLHLIGQSHIDLAWLWPMEETFRKVVRTYANQLSLMEEYPEYRFLACEPALLEMLEESAPDVFASLLGKIQNGQVVPDGAFYVECDTMLPSGESLIRQLAWGKRWFRGKLGVESRVAWQPDTFGFSPCLPQLLLAFDIPYFATQKLLRADPECERFPYQDFIWEGVDGSRVQALCFFRNNSRTDPENLASRWERDRSQSRHIEALLYPFGYGDGGGGADRDMLEYLRREEDLEGLPRTVWSSLQEHFVSAGKNVGKNLWMGELYLPWHRGAYTVQRKTKTALQALEQALHDGEFVLSQCGTATRTVYQPVLTAAWKTLLLHQFHDIAAGVGIRDVHAEAVEALTLALDSVRRMTDAAAREAYDLSPEEDCVTVINTLPFARREWIPWSGGKSGWVSLPASGARVIHAGEQEPSPAAVRVRVCDEGFEINNGVISLLLRTDGTISDLTDLRSGFPLQAPDMRMNDFRLYRNVEPVYDAWELSPGYRQDRLDAVKTLSVTLDGEDTELVTALVRRRIGDSFCEERILVHAGRPEIGFEAEIDWQERHKLLKVHFETNILSDQAIHDMQFCHIRRPAHRSTAFARDRFEVCSHHYSALFEASRGVALMKRAIWGISCDEGDMALTLLRAPCVPDDTCDRGRQHFAFSLTVWNVPFALSSVTQESCAFNTPPLVLPGKGRETEGIWAENALIETVKPADHGPGTVIRLWEYRGTRTRAILHPGRLARICACGMDEENVEPLAETDRYALDLPAFAVRTFMIL